MAICCAPRAKRYRPDVLAFNANLEANLWELHDRLAAGLWRPSGYAHFVVYEPKKRLISAAPYADRVVHHAICNLITKPLTSRMIFDCWANRRGKGSHRAVLRYQRFAQRYRYVLKCDIRKYFASIDHRILCRQMRQTFKERKLTVLLQHIVDSGAPPVAHDAWFQGDDLLTPLERPKGLPIGNLTSQLWASSYLCEFDHWVKQELRARAYVRFVDDFVLLANSKSLLYSWIKAIENKLAQLRLMLHPVKSGIQPTCEGLSFLGYVVWPSVIRVRGETVRRFRSRHRCTYSFGTPEAEASLTAWQGHIELAGTHRRRPAFMRRSV